MEQEFNYIDGTIHSMAKIFETSFENLEKSIPPAVQVHRSFTIRLYLQLNLLLEKLPRISGPRWLDHFQCHEKIKLNFQN